MTTTTRESGDMPAPNPYAVRTLHDGFELYELTDAATNSTVLLCPERGGIVIGCALHGRELLYLDRDTFLQPDANIRGGIPVLFPICGQLVGGQYEWNGRTYAMRNHGVARTEPWTVEASGTDNGAYATLSLSSSEKTLAAYPFAFKLTFTYRLKDGTLTIEQRYDNLSDEPMPVVAGFHPYFNAERKHVAYETDATQMLDYNDNEIKPFDGSLDLGSMVESAALLNASAREIAFPVAGGAWARLSYSQAFKYVVLWSFKDKPFICVEPWTALNEALNRKEGLLLIEPDKPLRLRLAIDSESD